MKPEYQGQPIQPDPAARRYLNAIGRKLRLPKKVKQSVLSDLATEMLARAEAGEGTDRVMEEMGSPQQVAEGIHAEMQDLVYEKNPWRWGCLGLSAVCTIFCMVSLMQNLVESQAISIIGGADGPTEIYISGSPVIPYMPVILAAVLAAAGLLGFVKLSRCRKKQK